jgi:hypothetical protein
VNWRVRIVVACLIVARLALTLMLRLRLLYHRARRRRHLTDGDMP